MKHSILFFLAICVGLMTHAQVPSYVPTDGLVAWYPLDGMLDNSISDEFDGLSFNGNFIPNRFDEEDGAAGLPGNHLLELPLNPALLSNDFSISFWVFKRSNSVHNPIQIWADGGPGRVNFGFNALATNGAPFMNEGNCSGGYGDCGITDETTATPSNEWIHFVYVVKGDDSQIFLNGNELTLQKNCTLHLDCEDESMSLWFGGDVGGGATEYFNGDFDDIGIWHGALTPQEIWSIYAGIPLELGCTEETACNYDSNANSDDGNCIPSGCMDPDACNYNDLAQCEGEACDYSCPPIPSYVPTDGLVAWYEMNGGTLDSSPNENHGIPTGVSPYPDRNGIESGALWFNGSGDHIIVPYSESIGIQAEFSSAVWVYLQGGGCNPRVYEIHESLNCGGYNLAFNGTSGNPRTFHGSNFGNCQLALAAHSGGSASVQPGEWHHIAVTFMPGPTSNGKLYVDGVLVNEATHSQDISGVNYYGAPLYIGNIAPNRCDWYGGGMDELGFWGKTLSPEEIWSIYVGEPLNLGCTDETACNFTEEANSDDGSCIPSGCMDPEACNYNDMAECEGEACDYSCPEIPIYVPTNGLVAWFPFNGNAIDESWNGHDAEVDGASLSTDRFGNSESAYVFDGNDRIFPSNPEGFPVAERTTSIWMKSNVEVTGGRALFGYGGGSCGSSWLLTYNNQGNQPYAYHSFELQGHCNAFATAAAMPSSEFENWHHIVLRTSVEGTDIFVDGVLTTQSSTFVNNTQPNCAVLGAVPSPGGACIYQDSANDLWSGFLDDFAIWNRALTDEEIESLYFSDFETGCTDSYACNFDAAATLDDGSCEYGCNYCGPGTSWDADAQICVVTISPYLNEPGEAAMINPCYFDSDRSGLVEVTDLMNLLSVYGMSCFWECGDLVNHQGHDYATVQIGEQCWFAENLSYIPNGESALNEGNVSTPAAYTPVGDEDAQTYYNHYAAVEWDLCPTGWHVPSLEDWETGIAEYETGSLEVFNADGWSITLDGYWDGSVLQAGAQATLWSNDIRPEDGWGMFQNFISSGNQYSGGSGRDSGATIRCIQD